MPPARQKGIGAAHAGNPDHDFHSGQDRPGGAIGPGHPGLLQAPTDGTPADPCEGSQPVSRLPGSKDEGLRREPGSRARAVLPLRGGVGSPGDPPVTPPCVAAGSLDRETLHVAGLAAHHQPEPVERPLGAPGAAQLHASPTREPARQPEHPLRPAGTHDEARSPRGRDQHPLRQCRLQGTEGPSGEGESLGLRPRVEPWQDVEDLVPRVAVLAGLRPEGQQLLIQVRQPATHRWEQVAAQPGAEVGWVAVRRIDPDREASGTSMGRQLGPAEPQQRSNNPAADFAHSRETRRPRAPEGPHEDGLDLIIGVMGREHGNRIGARGDRFEPGIARLPRRCLRRPRAEREASYLTAHSQAQREGRYLSRDALAVRVNPVVAVRHDEMGSIGCNPGEQVQEHHGIQPAGDRDESGSGRQREGVEPRAEFVEEIHRRKATRAPRARTGVHWFSPCMGARLPG